MSFERTELRRYSVWDQQDLELSGFQFEGDEMPSSGILLFYVSEAAAAAVQRDLCQLCVEDEGSINTGVITGRLFYVDTCVNIKQMSERCRYFQIIFAG